MRHVIILGSGPAGLTAALYAARADLKPLVAEGFEPGGQLTLTTEVENFPGFPEGIMGPELMDAMKAQAEKFGAEFVMDEATAVDLSASPFKVTIGGEVHETEALIIATGASAKMLGLESEQKLLGRGVSTCATCDGAFFRDRKIAVVGGGDSAMEEATFLTKFASSVTIIHRRDALRASKVMQDRAQKNPKIHFLWNTTVDEVLGVEAGKVTGLRLRNVHTDERSDFACDGLFIAIGHTPNTKIFADYLDLDEKGYIKVEGNTSETKIPGVFVAGDVHDLRYRQAITAAGAGCKAAIDAERWLESRH